MTEYIEREAINRISFTDAVLIDGEVRIEKIVLARDIEKLPAADVAPVRHGRWILQANNERTNCRWNVTAECSECCDEKKEIWAGFFPNVPDWLARDVALESAKSVKLSNYCPNCGAKMEEGAGV